MNEPEPLEYAVVVVIDLGFCAFWVPKKHRITMWTGLNCLLTLTPASYARRFWAKFPDCLFDGLFETFRWKSAKET